MSNGRAHVVHKYIKYYVGAEDSNTAQPVQADSATAEDLLTKINIFVDTTDGPSDGPVRFEKWVACPAGRISATTF